jgi:hypothetical protein
MIQKPSLRENPLCLKGAVADSRSNIARPRILDSVRWRGRECRQRLLRLGAPPNSTWPKRPRATGSPEGEAKSLPCIPATSERRTSDRPAIRSAATRLIPCTNEPSIGCSYENDAPPGSMFRASIPRHARPTQTPCGARIASTTSICPRPHLRYMAQIERVKAGRPPPNNDRSKS